MIAIIITPFFTQIGANVNPLPHNEIPDGIYLVTEEGYYLTEENEINNFIIQEDI